ncbi:MAG: oligosaccharide flippase family protein [Thermodesulfovibrionales bacterium]|nr:oligosaccharide flippase family protein [Thermodesulfovibrionales bacterium]
MLKHKFVLTYGVEFVSLVIGIASGIVVARIGGPNVVGTLAFGMAFVAVFQFVTDLGISTAQQKLVTSTDDIRDYVATFAVLKITTSFLFLMVIISYYYAQVHFMKNRDIARPEIRTVIFIYIAIYFIDSLNYIFRTNFIARTERAKVEIPTFLQSTLDKTTRIVLVALGFGAIALATSSLLYVLLIFPVNYYLFKSYKFGKFRKDLVKKYVAISLPVIVILFAQQWTDNIDRIMLQRLHGTYELGLYMAAFSLTTPVKLLGSSMGSILFPSFSSLLFQGRFSAISDLIVRYRKYLVCIMLPFIILLILFSSHLVPFLFGSRYAATIRYFPYIILTIFIYIYTMPYLNLAFANGMFRRIAAISMALLFLQAGLIYMLSAKSTLNLKGLGAAISLMLVNMILFIVYDRISRRIIEIRTDGMIWMMIGFQFALGALAMIVLARHVLLFYIIVPILYLLVVFSLEWKFKMITRDDLRFFMSLINVKPLLKYVKDEINTGRTDETP